MKKKIIITIILIILLVLISIILFINNSKGKTYEEFSQTTKKIVSALNEEYNAKIIKPIYIAYPANPEKYPNNPQNNWSKDTFNTFKNDLGTPKKISLLVQDGSIYSTVDFIYTPEIKGKTYINMNRITKSNNDLKEISVDIPFIYLISFTIDGMVIEITTFTSEMATEDKPVNIEAATHSNQMALFIQNYIVENGL